MSESVVYGYSEISFSDNMSLSTLSPNTWTWYDWAYLGLEGFDLLIPARMLMILDLTDSKINHEVNIDPDSITRGGNVTTI